MDLVPFFDAAASNCLVLLQLTPFTYQSLLFWADSNSVFPMDFYHQIHYSVIVLYVKKTTVLPTQVFTEILMSLSEL
jgi:hypothetical protein